MSFDPAAAYRYAIYAVPPAHGALWQRGRQWLGRCAETGAVLSATTTPATGTAAPEDWRVVLQEPRRYGWHATLRAPFRLREGVSLADLRACMQALARHWGPLPVQPLHVTLLGHFLALCAPDAKAGHAHAQACLLALDELAAPLTADELARRRQKSALDAREDALLQRWGYPHVLDRYRLHYSLTGSLQHVPAEWLRAVWGAAREHFDGLGPQSLGAMALFAEPAPGADFRLLERF